MRHLDRSTDLDDALSPYRDVARAPSSDRPWVLANMVCGLDGSTAIEGRVGALSGPTDRQLFRDLRSVADVVLVGAETARRESYRAPRLDPERRETRKADGRPPVPRLAIVSRSLRLDDARRALEPGDGGEPPLVVTCEDSPDARRERLRRSGVDVLVAGSDRVDVPTALARLRDRGVDVVICEGGPSLLGELMASDCLDELCLTLAPVVGGDPLPVAILPATASQNRATLRHVLEADGDLFLRYEFGSGHA